MSHLKTELKLACYVCLALLTNSLATASLSADPCGMVPPIYTGTGSPITRTGLQQTYVFYKDGIETLVIRPGFEGKIDNFGMLIPFPAVPDIRKVSDNIFAHMKQAIDPPEIVIDMRPVLEKKAEAARFLDLKADAEELYIGRVNVIKEEAVGMYQVAVLEAKDPKALEAWMTTHDYVYPKGMDDVCGEYIEAKCCFVAVKANSGNQPAGEPKP